MAGIFLLSSGLRSEYHFPMAPNLAEKPMSHARDHEDDDDDEDRPRSRRRRRDDDDDDEDVRSTRKRDRVDRSTLRSIALFQKAILICILVYLGAVVANIAVPQELRWIIGLFVGLPTELAAAVLVFLLAIKVYNPVVGVLLGFLTLIPCVGLIVLLIINGQATSVLRRHGISVGLLGARLSDID